MKSDSSGYLDRNGNSGNGNGNGKGENEGEEKFTLDPAIVIRRRVLSDPTLKIGPKSLFVFLLEFSYENQFRYYNVGSTLISVKKISRMLNASKKSINTWKKKLVEKGLIWISTKGFSNMGDWNVYHITHLRPPAVSESLPESALLSGGTVGESTRGKFSPHPFFGKNRIFPSESAKTPPANGQKDAVSDVESIPHNGKKEPSEGPKSSLENGKKVHSEGQIMGPVNGKKGVLGGNQNGSCAGAELGHSSKAFCKDIKGKGINGSGNGAGAPPFKKPRRPKSILDLKDQAAIYQKQIKALRSDDSNYLFVLAKSVLEAIQFLRDPANSKDEADLAKKIADAEKREKSRKNYVRGDMKPEAEARLIDLQTRLSETERAIAEYE